MKKIFATVLLVLAFATSALAQVYPKVPVLMIHGLGGKASGWDLMKSRLAYKGYNRSTLFALQMMDNQALCSTVHLAQIEAAIDNIKIKTGSPVVDVIGHSRGGMNLYDLMKYGTGTQRVRNWIAMGSPLAWSCYRMIPPDDPTPGDKTLYTSIYSTTDELVEPELTYIDGARWVEVRGVSHYFMQVDSRIFPFVLEGLRGGGDNNGQ